MKNTWTPQEANRTLPLVKRIVADVLACGREWRNLSKKTDDAPTHERVAYLEGQLAELMRELEGIGCTYKDWGFDKGLIDFPARIDGRSVYLCWRSDEPAVLHFHARDEGFDSRQPIPAEMLT